MNLKYLLEPERDHAQGQGNLVPLATQASRDDCAWPEYSLAKSFTSREKYRITDPNTVMNITSPQTLGKVPPLTGYGFSGWYTPNPKIQASLRLQF